MAEPFATVNDIKVLFRPLTPEETARAEALLPLVSDELRQRAIDVGKDLDRMIIDQPTLASVAKIVTVDVVSRILRQDTQGEPMAQEAQSGLGYSWSGTYAIQGGGIGASILYNDLKQLGLLRQQIGAIELWRKSKAQR